ncbi:phenylalanine--tRNA ligase subunit alpha [Sphingomonas lutea]|uniref:Phenylalanine--tRNA ligase alpha subunit n=1 Tax=Sphingomonas lutea TaxID=1045317 RepID=A0A7G9SIK1_9SPHN|nr:phenylalanine--tRNA ligase subunit alpha [Sphingomonas lutea]QNN67676.1 phenylalanine--tRNA ligase subunit alpha [Sphingomonas lutea]
MSDDLLDQIAAAGSLQALDAVRVAALGKSGSITAMLKSLGAMDPATRAAEAPKIHALREQISTALAERKTALEDAELDRKLATETIDLSLPVDTGPRGTVHPVSQVMDELAEIFADLGFSVAEGPEIESQWYNFSALNMPENHPARAMQDTFYLEPREGEDEPRVLRTHTSPVQIRTMEKTPPPIRIIAPGRVYRSDSDATHTPMFHQIEGLVIDRAITLGHLKWTLETFLKAFFERNDVAIRMRPSYFPFTEPSAEVDVGYSIENGRRVVGGQDGWMEVLGSGMVHPRVIANCGLDPDEWQGFAFGTGVDRLAMLKYGMDDLRAFFDGDIRWLKHYGFRALDVPTLSAGVGA